MTNDGTGAAVATPAPTGTDYAAGQTGGSAAGYGSGYVSTNVPGPAPAYPGGDDSIDTTSGAAAPAAKPAGGSNALIGPKTKIWLIAGGSVFGVLFLYGYAKYRAFTWPLRKIKTVRRLANGLISEFSKK